MVPVSLYEALEPRVLLDAAATVDYSAGFVASEMTLNSGAQVIDGRLELTDTLTGQQSRSAFHTDPLPIDAFTTRYVYRATDIGPANIGGAVFVIQTQAPTATAPSVSTGITLGYQGIEPSAALAMTLTGALRLYSDTAAASLTTIKSEPLRPELGDFTDNHAYEFALTYDGDLLQLIVTDLDTSDRYYLHYSVDIPALVGSTEAWLGFTASTGSKEERRSVQSIESWTYYADADQFPPTAQMTINGLSPYQALEGNVTRALGPYTVHFDAADSYDIDGSVVQYDWDFGDGQSLQASQPVADHTYAAGTHEASLTVTDDDGHVSEPMTFTIQVDDQLDAEIEATRVSGTAPLAVSFDATGTRGLTDGDFLNARFAWDFDVTDTDPTGRYEQGEGFVAGHVFEQPGTYTVRLTVTDTAGLTSTEEVIVNVGGVDETWTTYYFANDGADANPGTIDQPKQTLTHAFVDLAAPNVRLRFKRGDHWQRTSGMTLAADGPVLVDAYVDPADPSEDLPQFEAAWVDGSYFLFTLSGSDWRFTQAEVYGPGNNYDSPRHPGGLYLSGANNLIADCNLHDMGQRVSPIGGTGNTLLGNYVRHAGAYFVYSGNGRSFNILGNDAEIESDHEEHVLRFQGGYRAYVAHNTLRSKQAKSNIQVRGQSNLVMIYDNDIVARTNSAHPQNDVSEEYVHHVVYEGNRFLYEPAYEGICDFGVGGTAVVINARHVALRNNLTVNYSRLFSISGHPLSGPSRDIYVLHNTTFSDDTVGPHNGLLGVLYDGYDVTLRGNLVHNRSSETMDSWVNALSLPADVASRNLVADHNLFFGASWNPDVDVYRVASTDYTLAQWQAMGYGAGTIVDQDPDWMSVAPGEAGFAKPSATSPAIDGAGPANVWIDIDRVARPQGSAADIGAYERPAALPGDANEDGAVTDADYTIWADHYGATGASFAQGDFNGDGTVSDADYTVWADHYGQSAAAGVANVATYPGEYSLHEDTIAQRPDAQDPADLLAILSGPIL
jgi:PKD repeat protein